MPLYQRYAGLGKPTVHGYNIQGPWVFTAAQRGAMTPGQQMVGTLAFSTSALLLSRAQRLGEASFPSVGTEVTETDICEHFLHTQPTRGLPGNRCQGLLPA